MSFFPAYLNLTDKKVLLVGGGAIALEKLEKLIVFTQDITVISQAFSEAFLQFAALHALELHQQSYRTGDIEGYDVVIIATNTIELHRLIYEESRKSRILVNSVDDIAYCDFIFPSFIKKGDLTISISTSGTSPALARQLRLYLEQLIPDSIESFLQKMKQLRQTLPKGKERMVMFEKEAEEFIKKYFNQTP